VWAHRVARTALLIAAALATLVALVIVFVAVCSSIRPPVRTVRGVLMDVRASSLVHAESVTLRDEDGRVWTFRVDPEVVTNPEEPQSASHLRQHMVLGEPMLVRYRETSGGPLALRILDAE
jgi:hypothetical protein